MDTDLAAAAGNIARGAIAGIILTIAMCQNECNNERIRRLTIATASLTPESTCSSSSSLYDTKRSKKLYRILFNTEKKREYIMHEKV